MIKHACNKYKDILISLNVHIALHLIAHLSKYLKQIPYTVFKSRYNGLKMIYRSVFS